ncbi:hypothetical protein ROLI_033470 [Roseobacter fucihabitans]|uniref:Phosphatidic acid phosphatase type 2/haloperoxidase domain-containing protein n=1 Tax=Roseobacter fucihabitans TaxID=1537242 RepID=A0ABZ2BXR1_9RHOB|nr:phosphatase PAP2 family protein [Roseobacter litoralis]MBC6966765.1 PAP2 superfamily protein [Roseobacter litoralis]
MKLEPHGNLKTAYKNSRVGLFRKMPNFKGDDSQYQALLQGWLDDVSNLIWPRWEGGAWTGGSTASFVGGDTPIFEAVAEADLRICLAAFQQSDILTQQPDVHPDLPATKHRQHGWHYIVEDAGRFDREQDCFEDADTRSFDNFASRSTGSNFAAYFGDIAPKHVMSDGAVVDTLTQFESDFWGNIGRVQPSIWDIKELFMRPRPYTAATVFGMDDFQWTTADSVTHTGVHPSILSGHCIQGILGGCNAFAAWTARGFGNAEAVEALKQYAVDWGDRRVFAGVHYLTDNVGSWVLALRLIPHLYSNPAPILDFAKDAIRDKSAAYSTISENFNDEPLKPILDLLNQDLT